MTKRLIAKDTGKPLRVLGAYDIAADGSVIREPLLPVSGDIGSDPVGHGMHRMVPSGDIVTTDEMKRRRHLD